MLLHGRDGAQAAFPAEGQAPRLQHAIEPLHGCSSSLLLLPYTLPLLQSAHEGQPASVACRQQNLDFYIFLLISTY